MDEDQVGKEQIEGALQEEDVLVSSIKDMYHTQVEQQMAAAIGARILPVLAGRANALAEKHKAEELQKLVTQLTTDNKKLVEAKLEEYRKALTPPTKEDIQKILDQEYIEFTLKVGHGQEEKEFVIRELPLAAEVKIVKALSKTLGERLQDISRLDWSEGLGIVEKVKQIMTVVPGAMDTLADCCAIVLDPWNENGITADWVMKNVGATRLINILSAQFEVSKYRDFFSQASRFMPRQTIA